MAIGIHFFRKDLRVYDNLALSELTKKVDRVIGVFIFDSKQIKQSPTNKAHYSKHAAQFVIDSVRDLKMQCDHKLVILYGDAATVAKNFISMITPQCVSFNADYTPYAIKRDVELRRWCNRLGIEVIENNDDQTIVPMSTLLKQNGDPYMVYGTFFKNFKQQTVKRCVYVRPKWYKPNGITIDTDVIGWNVATNVCAGGRREGILKLNSKPNIGSDNLSEGTSLLGAYLNQGCLSIREVYWTVKQNADAVRSIAWRDFFLCIFRFHPRGNQYTQFIDERYGLVKWPTVSEKEWDAFMECNTGFLLVDASMAELLATGYVSNRSRMILATFWIKYMMISPLDPEYGSQVWFSRLLVDCNASQNKLNHLWVLGDLDLSGRRFAMKGSNPLTGRTMRIDNDMIKKYDREYAYLRKWIPSLQLKTLQECKAFSKTAKPIFDWKDRYMRYTRLYKHV